MSHFEGTHIVRDDMNTNDKRYFLSDLHWDNPHCERDFLIRTLEKAKRENAKVYINGDFFCFMQGRGDPRRSKSEIRPEHNKGNYIDAVINDAVEFFTPYANLIKFIGYGNHECYRIGTEVLTSKGWIQIHELDGSELVAQFDDKHITYAKPLAYVSKKVDGLVTIEGAYTKQVVSNKHAVVLNDMSKVNAIDMEEINEVLLPHGRTMQGLGVPKYSNDMIEFLTAIVMDGTFYDERIKGISRKARVQIKVSKPEKIEYFKDLFKRVGFKHSFKQATMSGVNKLQPYVFVIYSDEARLIIDILNGKKQLPQWFANLSKEQFDSALKGLINTDGYIKNGHRIEWTTTSKNDIDVLQIACIHNGYLFSFKEVENGSGFANGKLQYHARIKDKISNKVKIKVTKEDYDDYVYCLSMPNGNFITRYDGKVAYSGNTSVKRNLETDVLERFITLLNYKAKSSIERGGYGGWVAIRLGNEKDISTGKYRNFNIKYHHGWGGGGAVTHGIIQHNRMQVVTQNADAIWLGHTHSMYILPTASEKYNSNSGKVEKGTIWNLRTPSFKEEHDNRQLGFQAQSNNGNKCIGYIELTLTGTRATGYYPEFVPIIYKMY